MRNVCIRSFVSHPFHLFLQWECKIVKKMKQDNPLIRPPFNNGFRDSWAFGMKIKKSSYEKTTNN